MALPQSAHVCFRCSVFLCNSCLFGGFVLRSFIVRLCVPLLLPALSEVPFTWVLGPLWNRRHSQVLPQQCAGKPVWCQECRCVQALNTQLWSVSKHRLTLSLYPPCSTVFQLDLPEHNAVTTLKEFVDITDFCLYSCYVFYCN